MGTEFGLWISVDGGSSWGEFKGGNFPSVAVRDIALQARDSDLVLATHGRGIWIVDDITPLRNLTPGVLSSEAAFIPGRPVQQLLRGQGGWVEGDASFVGDPAPAGVAITYYQRSRHLYGPLEIEVLDPQGKLVDTVPATKRRGLNRVIWSMNLKPPRVPRAASVAGNSQQGPRVLPGTYTLRLTKGAKVYETKLPVVLDRRADYDLAGRKAQFDAAMRVHALFGKMSGIVDRIEAASEGASEKLKVLPPSDPTSKKLLELLSALDDAKTKIVATKEGGAITGEERIREHADILDGSPHRLGGEARHVSGGAHWRAGARAFRR